MSSEKIIPGLRALQTGSLVGILVDRGGEYECMTMHPTCARRLAQEILDMSNRAEEHYEQTFQWIGEIEE